MKAACALICLALAQGISGSIFKQQGRLVDDLDIQPLEYIDQQQRQQWNQRQVTLQNQQNRDWSQSQELREQPVVGVAQYQHAYRNMPTQDSQEQRFVYRRPIYWHNHHHQKTHRHSNSGSSQESKEIRYNVNQEATLQDESQMWNPVLQNTVMNQETQNVQAFGDAIIWSGIQMAAGPNAPVQNEKDIEKIFGDARNAMTHIKETDKTKFHEVFEIARQENNEDALLNATQLAQKYQYPIEEHTITTDDGYILTVFRMPPKKLVRDVQKRPVVFLMHGVLGSADDWLLMGPGKSLAYMLSDAGYDVWLGNARGNKYSRRHVSKSPAVWDFWQFSNDEIALHDLPSMIDYALEISQQEKLYYIGHSQGTTAFFALTATRPEYNNKIIMMYALSPMVYMSNVRSPLFRMIAPTSQFQQRLKTQFGYGAFTPSKELIHTIGGVLCESEIGCKKVCSNLNFVMAGVNVDGMDANMLPIVMRHLPAGTSTKVIRQYGQGVASQEFRRFDYGAEMNQQAYGTQEPPKYDMTMVQAPVTLYYSTEDWLAHPQDVMRLQKELPNVTEAYKVPVDHFSNMDFQFSTKAPEVVYTRIIESMKNIH